MIDWEKHKFNEVVKRLRDLTFDPGSVVVDDLNRQIGMKMGVNLGGHFFT